MSFPTRAALVLDLAMNLFMEAQKMMILYKKARAEDRDISDTELSEVIANNDDVMRRVEAALEVRRKQ